MIQPDLNNPTLEFLDYDPSIAAEYGATDSINYLMHALADKIGIADNILVLPIMFLFNLLMAWILIYCIYHKVSKRHDYYMTFMLFSSAMFLLLWLMQILDIQTGFVLGLFAIFGMIRYRTETIPIREMTYLFIIIAQAVMNSLSLHADTLAWHQLVFANVALICLAGGFELWMTRKRIGTKIILYEKIENIRPENREALLADLKERTGLQITDAEIGHVDFLRDVAYIKVKYTLAKGEESTIGSITKFKE